MSDLKIGQAGGALATAEPSTKLGVLKNCIECLEKLSKGDMAGALNELKQACDAAKGAAEGMQEPAPGQGMDLYELLRQILEQGKRNSEANAAPQVGGPAIGSASSPQGNQQAGMAEMVQMLVQLLLQDMNQGPQKAG